MNEPKLKSCSKCKAVKRHQSFFPDARNRSGLSSECKGCRTAATKAWKDKWGTEYKAREAYRRRERQFGISLEEYTAIHEAQKGRCAICQKPEVRKHQSGKLKTLAIDHNHATGAIRELLCSSCNNALGSFGDSPELLEKAAAYLRKHAEKQTAPIGASEQNWETIP